MRRFLLFTFGFMIFWQGCNTLYNTQSIDLEVLEPGKVKLPSEYKKLAIRNNNTNMAHNPRYACYFIDTTMISDKRNIDSLATWIYYDYILRSLHQQKYLDTIVEIAPADYSGTNISDSLPYPEMALSDSSMTMKNSNGKIISYILSGYLKTNALAPQKSTNGKKLDPDNGLYSSADIQAIADSTKADFFLSLDHFVSFNSIAHSQDKNMVREVVLINTFWTLYDLRNFELNTYFQKSDTIDWVNFSSPGISTFKLVPERRDAVLNAADVSGTRFAEFLVPHWLRVERFYYRSGHVELKQTNKLIEAGKWIKAAKIWKNNIDNPNRSIQAKCMFNLALASEMNGDMDAALDWVVQSYHVFGEKNELHSQNCKNYIQILAQRRIDAGRLNDFFSEP